MSSEHIPAGPSPDSNPLLAVSHLTVAYRQLAALDDLSLDIHKGKIYAIIGPNGCGKTTLIRAMSRSLKPRSGQILLEGQDIFQLKTKHVARKMAVLGQDNRTISDVTVKELVQYGRYAHKEWWQGGSREDSAIVDWALEKTALADFQGRKLNTLSGGERQRAWIAMSVAQKPEIMLLDEPTTYLDIAHQLEIMELIARLNREEGITIVMVLHDVNHAARYADQMVVLHQHRVYRQGDPWDILESPALGEVFRVEAEITRDRETAKPIFYARRVI